MINSADFSEFRAFRFLRLKGLKKINILVGDNGCGKTSLLEGLFLSCGNTPQLARTLGRERGLELPVGNNIQLFELLWADLFRNFDKSKPIALSLNGDAGHSRTLRISLNRQQSLLMPPTSGQAGATTFSPIVFEWAVPGDNSKTVVAECTPNQIRSTPPLPSNISAFYLGSGLPPIATQLATWFSALSKSNRHVLFVDALRKQYPDIEDVSIEEQAGKFLLFVKIRWMPNKVPLNIVSEGLTRFSAMMLATASVANGICCIDEVENGIHHSRHPKVWAGLSAACHEFNVQIFASTHSLEFLRAGAEIFRESLSDVALIQVFQRDGISDARVVSGSDLLAALDSDTEIRTL